MDHPALQRLGWNERPSLDELDPFGWRVVGYFIWCCVVVLLLLLIIEKRNAEIEVPQEQNEVKPRVSRPEGRPGTRVAVGIVKMVEVCPHDNPHRSKFAEECDRWEKSWFGRDPSLIPLPETQC